MLLSVWPDVRIKSSQTIPKVALKVGNAVFLKKWLFKIDQKVAKRMDYICRKMCCQDLSKTVQSGLTVVPCSLRPGLLRISWNVSKLFVLHCVQQCFRLLFILGMPHLSSSSDKPQNKQNLRRKKSEKLRQRIYK